MKVKPQTVTLAQAARELGVGRDRIRAGIKAGALKAVSSPGGRWKISRVELARWWKENLKGGELFRDRPADRLVGPAEVTAKTRDLMSSELKALIMKEIMEREALINRAMMRVIDARYSTSTQEERVDAMKEHRFKLVVVGDGEYALDLPSPGAEDGWERVPLDLEGGGDDEV